MNSDNPALGINAKTLIAEKPFSVSARVAMQLGRESISSSTTAILELVKNAYDADAALVVIRFRGLASEEATLVIQDDGIGMTVDELSNKWLVIGTPNKAKRRISKGKRVLTGEKGLGRLGLDRLCSRTTIQTVTEGADYALEYDIKWGKYEGAEDRLETIQHPLFKIPNLNTDPLTGEESEFNHGTRLILEGLKDDWSTETLADLRRELSLLLSPFGEANDFVVMLETDIKDDPNSGPIAPPDFFFEAAYWRVNASLSKQGQIEIRMSSGRHDTEFHFKPEKWENAIKGMGNVPLCGPLNFEFYFFPRMEAEYGEQVLKRGQIKDFLDLNQGIRIYRDGFRVKPYGQPTGEGDWLSLAIRRVQHPEGVRQAGTWRVGPNQVIGAVFITREDNPSLGDQTNREGLLEGPPFSHLRAFAQRVVRWFEEKHKEYEKGRVIAPPDASIVEKQARETATATDEAQKKLTELSKKLQAKSSPSSSSSERQTSDDEVAGLLRATQDQLDRTKALADASAKAAQEAREHAEKQKDTLSNLASLGILAASFGHETVNWAGNVVKNAEWLNENIIPKAWWISEAERPELQATLTILEGEAKKLRKFAKFALGNITREKRHKTQIPLLKVVDYVFRSFDEILTLERKIQVDRNQIPQHECWVDGYETDWECIFVNLITNASWAMEDTPAERRTIKLTISTTDDQHMIVFADSGRGLEADTEKLVFEPTFTTRRNRRGEETGTGLGLTIVKEFVEENSRGTITSCAKNEFGGASFIIHVPKVAAPGAGKRKS